MSIDYLKSTIDQRGISQVINISSGGISFRSRCKQCLLKKWKVDIVDSMGTHLQALPVEKIWESAGDKKGYAPVFTTMVGVRFQHLSAAQQLALDELIY
jgi:hypothetical protein